MVVRQQPADQQIDFCFDAHPQSLAENAVSVDSEKDKRFAYPVSEHARVFARFAVQIREGPLVVGKLQCRVRLGEYDFGGEDEISQVLGGDRRLYRKESVNFRGNAAKLADRPNGWVVEPQEFCNIQFHLVARFPAEHAHDFAVSLGLRVPRADEHDWNQSADGNGIRCPLGRTDGGYLRQAAAKNGWRVARLAPKLIDSEMVFDAHCL